MSSADSEPADDEPRRRGRRPHTDEESARVRDQIMDAFAEVFADHGYHGLTVARILDRAQIARGTYYRYFGDIDEPMTLLLDRVTEVLADLVVPAMISPGSVEQKLSGAIDGYLEWGQRHRTLLPSLYAGLHDPLSPVAANRTKWIGLLIDLIAKQYTDAGVPSPTRDRIEVVLSTSEFTCYRHYLTHEPDDTVALRSARNTMMRVAVALLTPPGEWQAAAAALDIR